MFRSSEVQEFRGSEVQCSVFGVRCSVFSVLTTSLTHNSQPTTHNCYQTLNHQTFQLFHPSRNLHAVSALCNTFITVLTCIQSFAAFNGG